MNEHPEISEYEWIDDCFRVWKTRFGLWSSETEQEGTLHLYTRVVGNAFVSGKL